MRHKKELILSLSCFLFAFLLTMIWVRQRDENLAASISPEILRFHVLANSNTNEDQQLKLEVKTLLMDTINRGLADGADKEDTCAYIRDHGEELELAAEAYIKKAGYDYPAKVELTNCYFPTKVYGDVVFPCGDYDAARVTIGEGRGRNWWCVLYPQLCFVDASYGTVPEASKLLLEESLSPDDYRALFQHRPDSDPQKPVRLSVRFKLLDLLDIG